MRKKIKMKSINIGNVTWFFFNVYGLKIKRSKNWRIFLFGDATIADPEEVKKYLQNLNTRDEFIKSFGNPHSFLIVQVGGDLKVNEEKIKELGKRRAYEIISLIYFIFLYLTDYQIGVSLDYELFSSSGGSNIVLNGLKNYSIIDDNTKGEHWITAPTRPYILSKSNLLRIFNTLLFKDLSNIIINQNNKLHQKVSDSFVMLQMEME